MILKTDFKHILIIRLFSPTWQYFHFSQLSFLPILSYPSRPHASPAFYNCSWHSPGFVFYWYCYHYFWLQRGSEECIRIRSLLILSMAIIVVKATILSNLNYCSSLLIGLLASAFDCLQPISQNDTVKFRVRCLLFLDQIPIWLLIQFL